MQTHRSLLLLAVPMLFATACPPIKDSSEQSKEQSAPTVKEAAVKEVSPAVKAPAAKPVVKAEAIPEVASAGKVTEPVKVSPRNAPRDPADPAAARKKPLDIEALYRLPTVSDPRWSPDGKRLLLVVSRYKLREGKTVRDIYMVGADGEGLRRMTRHKGSDYGPRWAPDGKSFLFLSTREESTQVWRMPVDGGESEQLTHLSTGASNPSWTPDGKSIVLVSSVYPEAGADDAANKKLQQQRKENPLKAHLADELLYRHWTSYRDGKRKHLLRLDLATKKVLDLTPGDFDSPAFSLGDGGYAISPDGKELCVVSNRAAPGEQAWGTNKDLWIVPLDGGAARNITAANPAYDGHPAYSPDGKSIAYLRQKMPGYEADRFELAILDRATGKARALVGGFDDWVLDFKWSADSASITFKAPIKGRFPLLRVNASSGKVSRLGVRMSRGFDLASDGRIAFIDTAVDRPTELFLTDAEGAGQRRITRFSEKVTAAHDLRPATEMWLPGAGGRKVHTFVVTPHGFKPGKRYPLIINVHGGPQYQWSDMLRGDWQVYPAAGYVVAFFNPHGSIGYGQKYTAAISKDWGGKVYQDVMKVTDALCKLDYVDPEKVGAMGWSYGGYMMNWLLGHTDRFKALASMMGLYDLDSFYGGTEELWFPEWDLGGTPWSNPASYRKWSPSEYAGKFKTPTLVITGEKDYRVPYTQSLQLFTALRRQGVPARLIVFPNDGHWPSYVKSMPLYYAAHLDWFSKYLGGGGSPWKIEEMVKKGIGN